MDSELHVEFMQYPPNLLDLWSRGDHSFLLESLASDYIKNILITKSKARHGRRFFGEAFIASNKDMVEGWYNSFKWLTAKKWLTGKGLGPKFEKPFYHALMDHIGPDIMEYLHRNTNTLFQKHREKFFQGKKYNKPVTPDLWLIDKDDKFEFIESKLPGDNIRRSQIAGLALIKKIVSINHQVSVKLISLYPEGSDKPKEKDYNIEFNEFYWSI